MHADHQAVHYPTAQISKSRSELLTTPKAVDYQLCQKLSVSGLFVSPNVPLLLRSMSVSANAKYPLDEDEWAAAQTEEVTALRHMMNDEILRRRASERNGGLNCEFDPSDPLGQKRMCGMHIHLRIIFSNGTAWLARILRHNYTSFSDDFSNLCLKSECATLKWLEDINVPSPKLYDFGLRNEPENKVGVAYMLIEELPGTPLLLPSPSEEQLRKLYKSYADILCTIYKYPIDQIGALSLQPDCTICIGPIVGDRSGTFSQIGPFSNAREYYTTWAEKYLEMICDHQLFTPYSVNAYLIFKYLKELAQQGQWNAFESSIDNGPFFSEHMDDKSDHILVDKDYNVTGVIDWTFARAVPMQGWASPGDRILAEAIQTRDKYLARFVGGPDLVRRFSFALGMGMCMSWDEAVDLFRGLISTAEGIGSEFDWDVWRQNRIAQWAGDGRLQALLLELGEI
ncbi:hypothetical protein DTO002I6_6101 [Penicillium roqueforti]|nr:hypothetical protein DTO002I6_6101 [Penicillium roqueforti]